jgi:hypothetical protein
MAICFFNLHYVSFASLKGSILWFSNTWRSILFSKIWRSILFSKIWVQACYFFWGLSRSSLTCGLLDALVAGFTRHGKTQRLHQCCIAAAFHMYCKVCRAESIENFLESRQKQREENWAGRLRRCFWILPMSIRWGEVELLRVSQRHNRLNRWPQGLQDVLQPPHIYMVQNVQTIAPKLDGTMNRLPRHTTT